MRGALYSTTPEYFTTIQFIYGSTALFLRTAILVGVAHWLYWLIARTGTVRGRAGPGRALHADLPLLATTNVGQRVHMGGGSQSSSLGIFLVSYRRMREFPAVVVSHGLDVHAHCLGVTVAKAGKASLQYSTTPPGAGTIAIVVHEMRFARRLPSPECGGRSSVTAHLRIVARDQ
jgi:hypothetical protein